MSFSEYSSTTVLSFQDGSALVVGTSAPPVRRATSAQRSWSHVGRATSRLHSTVGSIHSPGLPSTRTMAWLKKSTPGIAGGMSVSESFQSRATEAS